MKNKTNVYYVLPSNIKNEVNAMPFPTKKGRNKAKKFIALLIKKGMLDNFDLEQFREIPSKYFKKTYGNSYKEEFLDLLEERNIVQVNHVYSNFDTQKFSKSYRINPIKIEEMTEFEGDSYVNEREGGDTFETMDTNTQVSITKVDGKYLVSPVPTLAYMWSKTEKQLVRDDLNSLRYDTNRIFDKTKDVVSNICGPKFKTDEEVTDVFFEVYNRKTGHKYRTSKENAIKKAAEYGLTLIQDKRKYYIDDLDRYVALKKKNILLNYQAYSKKMEKGIYGVSRNTTNNRLDHLLTNICKETINIIKEDNNLIEIDLCNSQFAILTDWMSKEGVEGEDVELFYEHSTSGNLYNTLAYMWSKTDKAAKIGAFGVVFSSHNNHNKDKALFKQSFPSVIDFIDSFKRNAEGSEQFAIELQKREAQMFVDDLWVNIKRLGFFCLTKHDSLLVRKEDADEIVKIVDAYFNFISFKAAIKCGGEKVSLNGDTELITTSEDGEQVESLILKMNSNSSIQNASFENKTVGSFEEKIKNICASMTREVKTVQYQPLPQRVVNIPGYTYVNPYTK